MRCFARELYRTVKSGQYLSMLPEYDEEYDEEDVEVDVDQSKDLGTAQDAPFPEAAGCGST